MFGVFTLLISFPQASASLTRLGCVLCCVICHMSFLASFFMVITLVYLCGLLTFKCPDLRLFDQKLEKN